MRALGKNAGNPNQGELPSEIQTLQFVQQPQTLSRSDTGAFITWVYIWDNRSRPATALRRKLPITTLPNTSLLISVIKSIDQPVGMPFFGFTKSLQDACQRNSSSTMAWIDLCSG